MKGRIQFKINMSFIDEIAILYRLGSRIYQKKNGIKKDVQLTSWAYKSLSSHSDLRSQEIFSYQKLSKVAGTCLVSQKKKVRAFIRNTRQQ